MGESGCGKSTLGRMITRLLPASSGTVLYDGTDLLYIPQRKMLPYRRRIQMLFQHPDTSLNPRMTVLDSLREPFLLHDLPGKQDMDEIIRAHIEPYGIQPELLERRASQVSGGQIQRIVLARIMLLQPEFIVLDEPTSMLDVSVQAQIMDLLHQVQLRTGVSYLSHLPRPRSAAPREQPDWHHVPGKAAGTRGDRGRTECPYPPLYPGTD